MATHTLHVFLFLSLGDYGLFPHVFSGAAALRVSCAGQPPVLSPDSNLPGPATPGQASGGNQPCGPRPQQLGSAQSMDSVIPAEHVHV